VFLPLATSTQPIASVASSSNPYCQNQRQGDHRGQNPPALYQRDGVTVREPCELYDKDHDQATVRHSWSGEGRPAPVPIHSFRRRMATVRRPEAFVRRLMAQMEEDLGSKLDWVAVDHFNTGYPHTHVILAGRDDVARI